MAEGAPGQVRARRAAVLGHPVSHSLSPVLHRAAYAALGLRGWSYDAVDVAEGDLPGFVAGLDQSWVGLSVTMPLKRAVRGLLVQESALATQVGAVNTVVLGPDGRRGYNTDVHGIIQALGEAGIVAQAGVSAVPRAVVLGGGGTAAAALAALRDLGCAQPSVHLRAPERAGPLLDAAARLGIRPRLNLLDVDAVAAEVARVRTRGGVVISTLPAGAYADLAGDLIEVVVDAGLGRAQGGTSVRAAGPAGAGSPVLLDVVYSPWPTALAAAWGAAGGVVVGGYSMLVHQAEGQVRLMTGRRPPIDVMRAAGQGEMERRAQAQAG